MTTRNAEEMYLAAHQARFAGLPVAVFNPKGIDVKDLPVIYGFNNGGNSILYGMALAEDGEHLGGHGCTDEGYMLHDLGILEGTRPDLHEEYRKHYPDGYRMEFVSYDDVLGHAGLMSAIKKYQGAGSSEAERATDNREGDGSNPSRPTNKVKRHA